MHSLLRLGSVILSCWAMAASIGSAQGLTPVVMHTGSGNPLTTMTMGYTNNASGQLTLDFGFATEETSAPGSIPDSFTISITGPDGTGYLVTLDAAGTHWLPAVPGALPVSLSSLQWQTSPFLPSTEGLPSTTSYSLGYTLPPTWINAPLTINFALFDNLDPLRSFGYFLPPTSVPEPSSPILLALGLSAYAISRGWPRGRQ